MKIISAEVFGAYLNCPTKCWLRATDHPPAGSAYSEWLKAQNDSYRTTERERLVAESANDEVALSSDRENTKSGRWRLAPGLAVQVKMDSCVLETELHAVERVPAKGRGKPVQFIPIRFAFKNKLARDDKLLLAFDAFVLSKSLGREVTVGKIIHGDERATMTVKTSALAGEVRKRIEKITALLSSPTPPDLVLNRHCAECEFQARCREMAIEKDDLSLLSGMTEKERKRLHSKGIFTVTQLSYTFRPRRRPRKLRDKREKYHHSIKALAIRENKIHILGNSELKIEGTPVYLDVEGLPDRDFYYLIGMRIGRGKSAVQHSLWAATVEDENEIWNQFLDLLEAVENPLLFHYGSYETTFLKRMRLRYGVPSENKVGARAVERPTNLLSVIFAKVYFPTYSNSLKEIARFLNFNWSEAEASGSTAIVWRQQWERSHSHALMQKLITYNAEDCEALARLEERLLCLSLDREGARATASADFVHADLLLENPSRTFKKNHFQFAEFEQINQAAYWNYQREKVLVRSSEHLKRIARKVAKNSRTFARANKIVDWPGPMACPDCGGLKIYKNQTASKTVIDLRFGSASIRKWTTRYRFHRYKCQACRAVFYNSEQAWSGEKFGPNLRAFCVYQNIELRLSQRRIAEFLNQILGYQVSRETVHRLKVSAAAYYQGTYEALMESIVNGRLIHADETSVNLGGRYGYVWVFTNLEEAVYLYSPSREGDLVQQLLKDFKGVLVSDFYAAYDSIRCAQQKCLIHLIRDLNEDLYKEPFNGEFKELVGEVAALLKPMIETVDRFGLKTRFLRRHKVDVDRFFKRLSRRDCQSETTLRYKQRLEKNRDTLFTFLDHDGVPWNNNNAEHAIKAFAFLRRDFEGLSTEKGIKEYLILLSVCETCKFKGINFLDFLRSGEKDVHAFAEFRCGRTGRLPRISATTNFSANA